MKRNPLARGKYWQAHLPGKGLLSRIYQQLKNLTRAKQSMWFKRMSKEPEQMFLKRRNAKIQQTDQQLLITSLAIGTMQIKTK